MVSRLMLPGYCEIPLYEKVPGVGSNWHPHTIVWRICGYTIVDSDNYRWINQYRWIRYWNSHTRSYYAFRKERLLNGEYVNVYLAREILGLPSGAGNGGDEAEHINHNTLKNTRDNLRVASSSQNAVNRKRRTTKCRFKGVSLNGSGFKVDTRYNRQRISFPTVRIDVEAALIYNYAVDLLWGEFTNLNRIPEDEMPSCERQWELYEMVVKKLTAVGLYKEDI